MAESIRELYQNARFGIATVQPNRALKKCKIRLLRIEYFLLQTAVVISVPKSCGTCDRKDVCADEFVLQIIEKLQTQHRTTDTNFLV